MERNITTLHLAVDSGRKNLVSTLLYNGSNVNETDDDGDTPLHIAAGRRHIDIAKLLLTKGANVNMRNNRGNTPLHKAVEICFLPFIKLLLNNDADVNLMNYNGYSPLHLAERTGRGSIINFHLNNKVTIRYRTDYNGDLPLHTATRRGNLTYIKQLLSIDTDVNMINKHGNFALHIAVVNGYLPIIGLLLAKGANVNMINNYGDLPLHLAISCMHPPSNNITILIKNKNSRYTGLGSRTEELSVIKLLVSKGADVNKFNKCGLSPLHIAAENNNVPVVKLLVKKGADVNIKNKNGVSSLHMAIGNNNLTTTALLLTLNIDINIMNDLGDSPLHLAIKCKSLLIIKLLLSKGAHINQVNNRGDLPLHTAVKTGHLSIVRLLLSRFAKENKNENSSLGMESNKARKALNRATIVNKLNRDGDSPLHIGAGSRHIFVLELLVEEGADMNVMNNDGETPLHVAVYNREFSIVQLLLKKGANINMMNRHGVTPLHLIENQKITEGIDTTAKPSNTMLVLAVECGDLTAVELLLTEGADVDMINESGETLLHLAVLNENLPILKLLLDMGACVDVMNRYGMTPLHRAVEQHGNLLTVKLLLKKGANVNTRNRNGNTALHLAVERGNSATIELLLNKNADAKMTNDHGDTPLHRAMESCDRLALELLLSQGADVNAKNKNGNTVLHVAVESSDMCIVKLLLEKGADVNATERNDNSALHLAIKRGNVSIVDLLIVEGTDMDKTNENGNSPLHLAAESLSLPFESIEQILTKVKDFNKTNKEGDAPLHCAVRCGAASTVDLLLNKGIDVNIRDDRGDTPLHLAVKHRKEVIVEKLLNRGADINAKGNMANMPLHMAVKYGDAITVNLLLHRGADVNVINNAGNSPLHLAMNKGNEFIIDLLLDRGANIETTNNMGDSPLYVAVRQGAASIVQMLLNKGVDMNVTNKDGQTLLYCAAEYGNSTVVDLLLKNNANMHTAGKSGDTPLHLAVLKGDIISTRLLLRHGANVALRNENGETPLTVAEVYHFETNKEIINLLQTAEKSASKSSLPKNSGSPVSGYSLNFSQHDNKLAIQNIPIQKTEKHEFKYLKGTDTSGVCGHIYETKMLSLILLRALNDEQIDNFLLGTNIRGVGDMDDICMRYRVRGKRSPVVLFVQAKHKEDTEKGRLTVEDLRSVSGIFSLRKYFESYLTMKDRFRDNTEDPMFEGDIKDVECNLVIYTPAKECFTKKITERTVSDKVHYLINTGQNTEVFQYNYDETDVDFITKMTVIKRLQKLGQVFLEFIMSEKNKTEMILSDKLIVRYHVIMARDMVMQTKVHQRKEKLWKFRPHFFESDCEYLVSLKRSIFKELSTKRCDRSIISNNDHDNFQQFLKEPNADTLSNVIGKLVTYNNNSKTLEIVETSAFTKQYKTDEFINFVKCFDSVVVNENMINDAIKKKLLSMEIKLPLAFGNLDMTFRGNADKVQKRITAVANTIIKLLEENEQERIVHIYDEIVGPKKIIKKGFIETNGGIGSAVGNLLVLDTDTNMLKFNMDEETLPINATLLLKELKHLAYTNNLAWEKIDSYRIKANIHDFPQLSFNGDEFDKEQARDFFNKLFFYCDQSKQEQVEDILKCDINKFYNEKEANQIKFKINPHDIFLIAHNKIHEWWKITREGAYLDKECDFFERAKLVCINNLLLTVINLMHDLDINRIDIKFNTPVKLDEKWISIHKNIPKILNELCCLLNTQNKSTDINTKDEKKIVNALIKSCLKWQVNVEHRLLNTSCSYKKRTGTSAMRGHLYETKLLCLVFLRGLNDDQIDNLYLGNNIQSIGAMDDICLRYHVKGQQKPSVLFVQAKHRDDIKKGKLTVEDVRSPSGEFSLRKYFESYLNIKNQFQTNFENPMFEGDFSEVECNLVIYTPAKECFTHKKTLRAVSKIVHCLINTGQSESDIFQYDHKDVDVDILSNMLLTKQIKQLGIIFADVIMHGDVVSDEILTDKLIETYHVIIGREVLEPCTTQSNQEFRVWKFRPEFFMNYNEHLVTLRETLFLELSTKRCDPYEITDSDRENIKQFLDNPCPSTISKLIMKLSTFKSKNLVLLENPTLKQNESMILAGKFDKIEINKADVNKAIEMKLSSMEIKLPLWFGNLDMSFCAIEAEVQRRIEILAVTIINLLEQGKDTENIEINDIVVGTEKIFKRDILSIEGGIGSAVGNLLILDADTKKLKFDLNNEALPKNAACFLEKLKAYDKDLSKFRIVVNFAGFPKLSLEADTYDTCQATDFLNMLWFYSNQAQEDGVELILKKEINKYYENKISHNSSISENPSDFIYLRSHDDMQRWIQTIESPYLSRFTDIFKRAQSVDIYNLLLSFINHLFISKIYSVDLKFNHRIGEDNENIKIIVGKLSSSLFKIFDAQFDQSIDVGIMNYYDFNKSVLRIEIHPEMEWVALKMLIKSDHERYDIITKAGPGGGRCFVQDEISCTRIFVYTNKT